MDPAVDSEELELQALERKWGAMKALFALAAVFFVVINVIWVVEAVHIGGGFGIGDTTVLTSTQFPGGKSAANHHVGFWGSLWRLGVWISLVVLIAVGWHKLFSRLNTI